MTVSPFDEFYRAVHGHGPFPWLNAVAKAALADPHALADAVVDVPTGLGKTSLIDVGVWLAAATGCRPGTSGRRRTFFVVDRRIVVDDVHAHACRLKDALDTPDSDATRSIAEALRDLSGAEGDAAPLEVARMRGGTTWHWRWMDRPDRAGVVVGTADQLGSRLLFRGYGLSERLAPIDAALVGTDSFIVIDEAHLCAPLVSTLKTVTSYSTDDHPIAPPPLVVTMSATADSTDGRSFTIGPADHADPVASARLHAAKAVGLAEVTGPPAGRSSKAVKLLAQTAVELASSANTVGVVCNTVDRARQVFETLRTTPKVDHEVVLLTGRVRPWDRERLQRQVVEAAGVTEPEHRASRPPTIVVATQTIEVGANLDFDALVTESASWDALIQRLGRLNRVAADGVHGQAIVVHDGLPSPLYGDARNATWHLLQEQVELAVDPENPLALGKVGASPLALRALADDADLDTLVPARPSAPVLLPQQVDEWARTSPTPASDVPLDAFLHGRQRPTEEVHVVWRSDLWTSEAGGADQGPNQVKDRVVALPPVSAEQLAVPVAAFRRWITGRASTPFDDAIGLSADEEATVDAPVVCQALRWRADGDATLLDLPADLGRVRRDDVIVVPTTIGGCDEFGWAPGSTAEVLDVGDLASKAGQLRLEPPATLAGTLHAAALATGDRVDVHDERNRIDAVATMATACRVTEGDIDELQATFNLLWRDLPPALRRVLDPSGVEAQPKVITSGPDVPLIVTLGDQLRRRRRRAASDGGDPSSTALTGEQVTLADHQEAVRERTRAIATHLGFDEMLTEAVALAAAWHDVGKLDPRFQVMLHGGDRLAADVALATERPLAKSGMDPRDRRSFRAAHVASGLPAGFRHEVGSATSVRAHVTAEHPDLDTDLVVHLVGAHHGYGRPLHRPVVDAGVIRLAWKGTDVEHDTSLTVDWDAPARFDRLNHRYGHWGLALLEAVVRLSDIGCSEEGS